MNTKNAVVTLATSIVFSGDFIKHHQSHLHTHIEPEFPIKMPIGVNVYGISNNQPLIGKVFKGYLEH